MIGSRTYMAQVISYKLELEKVFHDLYEVNDVHNNDYNAMLSRAYYVQAREEASWFIDLPLYLKFLFLVIFFSNMCTFVCEINKFFIFIKDEDLK